MYDSASQSIPARLFAPRFSRQPQPSVFAVFRSSATSSCSTEASSKSFPEHRPLTDGRMLLVRKRTICMYSRGVILVCCKRLERGEGIMTDAKILEGKVVVVTGAGNGVGAENAKLAAASVANVLVRSEESRVGKERVSTGRFRCAPYH